MEMLNNKSNSSLLRQEANRLLLYYSKPVLASLTPLDSTNNRVQ